MTSMMPLFFLSLFFSLIVFLMPMIGGLAGVFLPAAGYFPALGGVGISLQPVMTFLGSAGAAWALWLSLFIGMMASVLSVLCCFAILACGSQAGFGQRLLAWHRRLMGPLIALPHSTIAIAMLFLLAPSGWLVRLISPELTGWVRPPAIGFVPDQSGWLLIAGLMMKEIPFLLFIALAQSQRLPLHSLQHLGQSFGYRPVVVWAFLIWPQIYRQMRLPIMAVLAYSLSVVDMTLILGPGLPPPLAVLVLQGFYDADLQARFAASAGAVFQIIVIIAGIAIWLMGEKVAGVIMRYSLVRGARMRTLPALIGSVFLAISGAFCLLILGLVAIVLWAFSNRWSFADKWPSTFGLRFWHSETAFGSVLWDSLIIAFGASVLCAMVLAFWLEGLDQKSVFDKKMKQFITILLFVPLFVPQISLLFGLQVALSWSYLDGKIATVLFVHSLYIMPYIWLILAPAYEGCDARHFWLARTMGYGRLRRFFYVRLPL